MPIHVRVSTAAALLGFIGLGHPVALAVEVDRVAGEVRFPCWFVNPTRTLEVFACHRRGPAHETVVAFDATGPAIYRALLELGCRTASYWNGAGPDGFVKSQGDRLLVVVRWEHRGERHERLAEEMLTEGAIELPMLVRGFSFGARGAFKVVEPEGAAPGEPGDREGEPDAPGARAEGGERARPAEDWRATGVPVEVEISLGASVRQRPSHPLITHPTGSARMQPWMLEPVLDTGVVADHRELVEKAVPATLVIRRVRSEADLVEVARAAALRRGLPDSERLYDALAPIAREVDALKRDYEGLLAEIRKVLEAGAAIEKLPERERLEAAERAKGLLFRGRWLAQRIEERYLSMYALEEERKAAWVEAHEEIPPEARDEARVLVSGYRFEPALARLEVQAAALDLPGAEGTAPERALRHRALEKELEIVRLERSRTIAAANLRYYEGKVREMRERKDAYVERLFEEDRARAEVELRRQEARSRLARTELAEIQGLLDGSWDAAREKALEERRTAQAELEALELEDQLLETLEEVRWAEGDLESGDAPRAAEAGKRLKALREKEAELRAKVREARQAAERGGTAAPARR
ncbi:MAG: hypothetical protein HY721_30975 [Planctomycetes bacterium]|nr:hypothetical protein [Planctomycetota bacterium]